MSKAIYKKRYPGPNEDLLEAQSRVCTGPHQTRPLGAKPWDSIRPDVILEIILKSVRGELPWESMASEAQMGAFFAAMTIRKTFPAETQWSTQEVDAFEKFRPQLKTELPAVLQFIMDPDCGYRPVNTHEEIVLGTTEKILHGKHLSYVETRRMAEAILNHEINPALKAAALIGQRMNRETYDEIRGHLDSFLDPEKVHEIPVPSLTHFGQPFDGATRYFRPTLFVAAVRASLGEASVLHGVDQMPPKSGVTEEAILHALDARTDLSLEEAAELIKDRQVGFAYVSQREYSPGAYEARELRVHIKKRPSWSATEKAQKLFASPHANYLVIGYYHPGYEKPLLQLAWDRGCQAALAVKGEEGTSHYTLRAGKPSTANHMAVNYSFGFRRSNGRRENFEVDLDARILGFEYKRNPRIKDVNAENFAKAGLAALAGEKGHIYDRIILNAGMTDYLLGIRSNTDEAIQRAKDAIDSGHALSHLNAYIAKSRAV